MPSLKFSFRAQVEDSAEEEEYAYDDKDEVGRLPTVSSSAYTFNTL